MESGIIEKTVTVTIDDQNFFAREVKYLKRENTMIKSAIYIYPTPFGAKKALTLFTSR